MKKLFAVISVVCMLCITCVPTFAYDDTMVYAKRPDSQVKEVLQMWVDDYITDYQYCVIYHIGNDTAGYLLKQKPVVENGKLRAEGGYKKITFYAESIGGATFGAESSNALTLFETNNATYELVYTSADVYDEDGNLVYANDPNFFIQPLSLRMTIILAMEEMMEYLSGSMNLLLRLGISCLALLMLVTILPKVLRPYLPR